MPNYDEMLEEVLRKVSSISHWTIDLNDYSATNICASLKRLYNTYDGKPGNAKEMLEEVLKRVSEISMYSIVDVRREASRGVRSSFRLQDELSKLWDKYTRKVMEEEK